MLKCLNWWLTRQEHSNEREAPAHRKIEAKIMAIWTHDLFITVQCDAIDCSSRDRLSFLRFFRCFLPSICCTCIRKRCVRCCLQIFHAMRIRCCTRRQSDLSSVGCKRTQNTFAFHLSFNYSIIKLITIAWTIWGIWWEWQSHNKIEDTCELTAWMYLAWAKMNDKWSYVYSDSHGNRAEKRSEAVRTSEGAQFRAYWLI